jgi:hypothetical protein
MPTVEMPEHLGPCDLASINIPCRERGRAVHINKHGGLADGIPYLALNSLE